MLTEPEVNNNAEEATPPPHRGLDAKELERKKELQTKKTKAHDKLPKKEEDELQELLKAEKDEYSRQALIHRLVEAADKYGRKAGSQINREVTDQVALKKSEESAAVEVVLTAFSKSVRELERATKAEMQAIQEKHNASLKELGGVRDEGVAKIRADVRGFYSNAEEELSRRISELTDQVGSFSEEIKDLEVSQLEQLLKEGILQRGENFLVVPGSGKEN